MTLLSFFGNLLTAFGPALVVLLMYVGERPQRFITTLASSFLWLVSMLIVSVITYFAPSLYGSSIALVILGSIFQELARMASFAVFRRADPVLNYIAKDPQSPFRRSHHAFASGYGSCPGADTFFIGAVTTCLFIFLHTTWSIVAFDGWFKNQWYQFVWVFVSHIGASMATLLIPSTVSGGCVYSILVSVVVLAINCGYCFWSLQKLKQI
ncbi:Aph-1 protein-domain-containing protein [Entophlyctis helioformis]|nr:Aph-1 protein-domain-containing protein [Entophlyctis helioformis]